MTDTTQNAPLDDGSLEASLARTARQYDAVPYMAIPFARLHTARLCALARILGLDAVPANKARTLEIGCATGGHIIPIAEQFPDARFVGLDVSAEQIRQGQERIDRLGLRNIELQARSLTELGPQDGLFDYIVCHGVYSWIPQAVRDALMKVVAERLSPNGVAVISFNVLPGWRMFQVVRDSMILHAGDCADHAERSARARQLFEMMEKHGSKESTYGSIWRNEAQRMAKLPDFYLAHELFEENNAPVSFNQFMQAASAHGLSYLAETRLLGNIPENTSTERAALIRQLSGSELVATEQYIDIVSGRTFRESLLIHAARAPNVDRSLDDARIAGLHMIAPMNFGIKESAGSGGCTIVCDDTEIDLHDSAIARAMRALVASRPSTRSLQELAPAGICSEADRANLASVLMEFVRRGLLDVTSEPVVCAGVSGRPRVWPLAASDAAAGLDATATLRHYHHELTPTARYLLPMLDGAHTREMLIERLAGRALAGEASVSDAAGPVTDPVRIRELAAKMVDRQIKSLADAGLLIG